MKYKIEHITTYRYSEAVRFCYNLARLNIRNTENQSCGGSYVRIDPVPDTISEYEDFFGNKLVYFAVQQEHKSLRVAVTSEVTLHPVPLSEKELKHTMPWEVVQAQLAQQQPDMLEIRQFVPATPATQADEAIHAYALQSFTSGRPVFEALYDLMQRIYTDFMFVPGFTTIATPLSVVFKERKGVCQDFAHLAIACVRSVGLAARYVSGYIETLPPEGQEKLTGVDASHAWFAAYIPASGWVDFDPTNNLLPAMQHVTVGWARDYFDIAPLNGVILSSGSHQLSVSVDMQRL